MNHAQNKNLSDLKVSEDILPQLYAKDIIEATLIAFASKRKNKNIRLPLKYVKDININYFFSNSYHCVSCLNEGIYLF